jgi:hypothetical protein
MTKKKDRNIVPKALQIQFALLFGDSSKIAKSTELTDPQWRKVLKKSLDEIYNYIKENVTTDELHYMMLYSGLSSAFNALQKDDFFWPGYIEGITRLCLLLLGEYPDHRKRKGGKKNKDHYKLNVHRKLCYAQDADQKVRVLRASSRIGFLGPSHDFNSIIGEFRSEKGFKASYTDFITWYRRQYPEEYSKLF